MDECTQIAHEPLETRMDTELYVQSIMGATLSVRFQYFIDYLLSLFGNSGSGIRRSRSDFCKINLPQCRASRSGGMIAGVGGSMRSGEDWRGKRDLT